MLISRPQEIRLKRKWSNKADNWKHSAVHQEKKNKNILVNQTS